MDKQPDRETTGGDADQVSASTTQGTDGHRNRLAYRSRISPPPWWLTREPSRWDQCRLHLTCAALHARESTRELYRAGYAIAGCDLWPRRWWVGVIAAALVLALGAMLSGCQWIGRKPAPGPATATGPATHAATLASATQAAGDARSALAGASAGRDARLAADVQAAGAALAIGAGIALGGVAALRRVGPAAVALGVVGIGCLGAAQIIGARWFLPVVGACGGGAVLWFAVWAYRHQRRGDLAQELAVRTGKVAAVAKTAVPVLDAAYEEADAGVKAWLDEHVFAKLSSAMGKEQKAAVHAVRAEAKAAEVLP